MPSKQRLRPIPLGFKITRSARIAGLLCMLFIIYKGAVKAVQQHDANAAKVAGMLAVLLVLAVIIRRKK